jgi:hypothetical protein
MVHVTLTDNSQVKKNVNYFVEHSTDSGATWHVSHLNASREAVLPLPTHDGNGNLYNYQFRGYSQYVGSDAQSEKAVFGGKYTPTNVNLTGTAHMTLLPAVGSGTAAPNGEQGGQRLGSDLIRPPQGPKRPSLNNELTNASSRAACGSGNTRFIAWTLTAIPLMERGSFAMNTATIWKRGGNGTERVLLQ